METSPGATLMATPCTFCLTSRLTPLHRSLTLLRGLPLRPPQIPPRSMGLAQGFTLESAPGERTGAPLSLALTLGGDLQASLEPGGNALRLSRADGTAVLRYRGLSAQDASGRELRAWLQVQGGQLWLRVD